MKWLAVYFSSLCQTKNAPVGSAHGGITSRLEWRKICDVNSAEALAVIEIGDSSGGFKVQFALRSSTCAIACRFSNYLPRRAGDIR
jgi:hypothetical protein